MWLRTAECTAINPSLVEGCQGVSLFLACLRHHIQHPQLKGREAYFGHILSLWLVDTKAERA